MFLLHNCVCLISIGVYSHLTIKQAAAQVFACICISILKAIDSTQKSEKFPFRRSLQAFERYIFIYKKQKGHSIEENKQHKSSFFPLFKKQIKKFVALLTKEKGKADTIAYLTVFTHAFCCITNKGKTTLHEWENDDDADKLQALCSRYKRLG